MRTLSISRLFVIGPLVVGLFVAWTSIATRSITGQRVAGGWERCDSTTVRSCKDFHSYCTGDHVACSKTWGAARDCNWLHDPSCWGASDCEKVVDAKDCPK